MADDVGLVRTRARASRNGQGVTAHCDDAARRGGHGLALPASVRVPVGVGTATSLIHHGEILQGVFHDDHGRLRRGLVSMPCDLYSSQAAYTPTPMPAVSVQPPSRVKARRAAQLTLALLGWPSPGGYLQLAGETPPARGFGSSTSDVLAAILAVQSAFGCELSERLIAKIAVHAETASDPLMFRGGVVLFAQRDGVVIEDFACRFPRLAVVGFSTSETRRGVDTLALQPAEYDTSEVARFAGLRDVLRSALRGEDPVLLGEVATASTAINQRHLPMGPYHEVVPLIHRIGALGLQTAHSGDIAGFLFDGRDPDVTEQQDLACALLRDIGIDDVWRFTAGG